MFESDEVVCLKNLSVRIFQIWSVFFFFSSTAFFLDLNSANLASMELKKRGVHILDVLKGQLFQNTRRICFYYLSRVDHNQKEQNNNRINVCFQNSKGFSACFDMSLQNQESLVKTICLSKQAVVISLKPFKIASQSTISLELGNVFSLESMSNLFT